MPGKRCSVAVCTNSFYKTRELSGEKHVGYFSFPKDPRLRKQWVEACKRKDVWNPENGHVCSVHFKEEDFERNLMAEMNFSRQKKILKPGSVPSLYLLPPKACKESKAIVEEVLMFEEASAITREHLTEPCELVEETVEEKYANLLEDHTKLLEEFKALKLEHKACIEAHQREVDEREALVESRVKEVLPKIFTEGQISLLLSDKKQVKCWRRKCGNHRGDECLQCNATIYPTEI